MKIGIFTQPLKSNYGGILQNYAMQVVLKRLGHEPWTVDYLRFTWWDWFVVAVKVTIKKCLGRKANYPITPTNVRRQENPLRRFALKYIQLTQPRVKYPNKAILQSYGFNALLVGSDQTWRPMYNGKIYDMYLQLAEGMDVKRVAYAASFGTDKWEYTLDQEAECARLAKLFDAISVREASGVGLCKEHLGVEATHVLDPTLLLTANDYNELCKDIESREPFVFAYILDMTEQKVAEIKAFAEAKGLPYYIKSAGSAVEKSDSVELWLSYFRDAAYVITDSFHGTAFSINYNKNFFVFLNEQRGNSRFDSLLNLFNLKNRVVTSVNPETPSINWEEVNKLLNSARERCATWLNNALN
jgi:hypothetical protein